MEYTIKMPQYFENIISLDYNQLLEKLTKCSCWKPMQINEQKVKSGKVGCFFGLRDKHNSLPYFRCPSFDEAYDAPEWLVDIITNINDKFKSNSNLVKIQQYINGVSGIGRHSDKSLDMNSSENILILRVNKDTSQSRSIIFKNKTTGEEETFHMKSGSVLVITPEENQKLVHYVPQEEDNASLECISFVFRSIGTFVSPESRIKYGIGAKFETYEERIACSSQPTELVNLNEAIVKMYHYENTNDLSVSKDNTYFEEVKSQTL